MLRNILPYNLYTILQSYITDRYYFNIKYDNECSDIMPVSAGVPQGTGPWPTHTKRQPKNFAIKINDNQLLLHLYPKYLGLTIDSKLTWKQHTLNNRNETKNKFQQLNWLIGKHSVVSMVVFSFP